MWMTLEFFDFISKTQTSHFQLQHLNARCLNLSPKRDMDSTTSSNEVSTNSIAMGSSSSSSGASRLLLFDRRYGWVIDEWRDPSEEALAGGRGMFCIVPLTKYLLKMASQSISFAASSTMNVIERPDMLSPHVLQTGLNNQLGKLKSFPKHFLSEENISSLDGNRP